MIAKIQELLEEVEKLKASNLEEVEALRIKYLSKKGSLNALMADFRNVPAEMKKEVGMKLNDLKAKAQEKIAALKEAVDTQDCGTDELDLTLQHISERQARFRTVIALILGEKEYLFEGIVNGEILTSKHGSEGFGYDPIFRPEGFQESFAEMPLHEKNKISHRGRAVRELCRFLNDL